jgi:aspartyl-tRNA(Asn)/glutamyl-tRNA(Gln) amidotransferase subunit B
VSSFHLPKYDADILTAEKPLADYFESVVGGLSKQNDETVKLASNWTMTEVLRVVNERQIELAELAVTPTRLASMINLIVDGTISGKIGKEVFEEMLASNEDPAAVVQRKGLVQISDTGAIEATIDSILAANPAEVEKFRAGKQQVFGFFVGEVMKRMKGKANPKVVNEVLRKKLE